MGEVADRVSRLQAADFSVSQDVIYLGCMTSGLNIVAIPVLGATPTYQALIGKKQKRCLQSMR